MLYYLLVLSLLNINLFPDSGNYYSVTGADHNTPISYSFQKDDFSSIESISPDTNNSFLNEEAIQATHQSKYLRSLLDFHFLQVEKLDSGGTFFQISSPTPVPLEIVQTPVPTKKIPKGQTRTPRPTATPPDIPPPADPNQAKLMIFFSIVAVSIILIGVWLNRRTFE